MSANVLKALAVTAELTGAEFSQDALKMMLGDLKGYPEPVVLQALDRCRKELRGRLTFGAILERIEESDGRPGADEAWAIAITAQDEAETVVWTEEIAQAFAVAQPILDARDKVGARMAFRDAYDRITREARTANQPVRWRASIGHDPERRAVALSAAVSLRRIEAQSVQHLLPIPNDSPVVEALIGGKPQAMLAAPDLTDDERETAMRGVECVRKHLAALDKAAAERRVAEAIAEQQRRERDEQRKAEVMRQAEEYAAARGIEVPNARTSSTD